MAISIGSAVGSGFTLIGKRPLAVLSWGVFYYLAIVILGVLAVAIVGFPMLGKIIALNGRQPDPTAAQQLVLGMMTSMWPALLVFALGVVVVGSVVQAAVIRSILTPEQRRYAYLRLGREEGALMLLALLYIPIFMVLCVVSLLFLGLFGAVGQAIHGVLGGLVTFLFFVAYALGLMWLALRFSLAAPMTFAAGGVRLLSSWELTKGEGWRLFGLAWLMVLVWIALWIGYWIISTIVNALLAGAALASIFASLGGASANPDPAAIMARLPIILLAFIPSFILGCAFNGLIQAVGQGPWADVYRQLKGPDLAATFS